VTGIGAKLATSDRLRFAVTLTPVVVATAVPPSVQLINVYPAAGTAVSVTSVPTLTGVPPPVTEPPDAGMLDVLTRYCTGVGGVGAVGAVGNDAVGNGGNVNVVRVTVGFVVFFVAFFVVFFILSTFFLGFSQIGRFWTNLRGVYLY
jgi:hypothetical protein